MRTFLNLTRSINYINFSASSELNECEMAIVGFFLSLPVRRWSSRMLSLILFSFRVIWGMVNAWQRQKNYESDHVKRLLCVDLISIRKKLFLLAKTNDVCDYFCAWSGRKRPETNWLLVFRVFALWFVYSLMWMCWNENCTQKCAFHCVVRCSRSFAESENKERIENANRYKWHIKWSTSLQC